MGSFFIAALAGTPGWTKVFMVLNRVFRVFNTVFRVFNRVFRVSNRVLGERGEGRGFRV